MSIVLLSMLMVSSSWSFVGALPLPLPVPLALALPLPLPFCAAGCCAGAVPVGDDTESTTLERQLRALNEASGGSGGKCFEVKGGAGSSLSVLGVEVESGCVAS